MDNFQLISYNKLRKAIGFVGLLLPVVVVLGSFISSDLDYVQPSISDYYFTTMGDVFLGCLCAVSFFLFCYKGHDNRDNIAANLAAFFGICIALFPTSTDLPRIHLGLIHNPEVNSIIHFTASALFFCTLSYFSLFLFTLSKGYQTTQKKRRNKVYRVCGYTMLSCLVLMAIYFLLPQSNFRVSVEYFKPITIFETVSLWAFGISWLTKSEAILSDKDDQ